MKIETKEDKVLAEGIDNYIVDAISWAQDAREYMGKALSAMENISLELPDAIDKTADEIIDELDKMEKKIRKAIRDWMEESLKYEDAIREFEKANNREGGRRRAC